MTTPVTSFARRSNGASARSAPPASALFTNQPPGGLTRITYFPGGTPKVRNSPVGSGWPVSRARPSSSTRDPSAGSRVIRIFATASGDGLSVVPSNSTRPLTRGPAASGTTTPVTSLSETESGIDAYIVASAGIGGGGSEDDAPGRTALPIVMSPPGGTEMRASSCGSRGFRGGGGPPQTRPPPRGGGEGKK